MQKNPPIDRLKFIDKQYGEKYPAVVFLMIDVIAHTVGEDRWKYEVIDGLGTALRSLRDQGSPDYADTAEIAGYAHTALTSPTDFVVGRPVEHLHAVLKAILPMVSELPGFKRPNAADGAFPWMAKQLVDAYKEDLRKAKEKETAGVRSFSSAWVEFPDRFRFFKNAGTTIGMWLRETRPNLNSMSFDDVKDEVEEFGTSLESVPQGEIVRQLSDGWTAQKLTTKEQLDAEGKAMQHCVGSYCAKVWRSESEIFSLRDKHGQPHVTIEFSPRQKRIVQVKGKQNEKPKAKYQKYVDEFLDTMPKLPANIRAIADVLLQEFGVNVGDDEAHVVNDAELWDEAGFNAADVKEWCDAGLDWSGSRVAANLVENDVTPEEFRSFPWAVKDVIMTGDARPSFEKFVDIARVAKLIREAENSWRQSRPKQTTMFYWLGLLEPYEDPRYHPDVFENRKKASPWRWVDFRDDDPRSLDDLIFPAEDWINTVGDLDPVPDPHRPQDDVREWILAGFNPQSAAPWHETGVDGYIHPKAAAGLVARGYKPSDFDDVEVSVDMDVEDLVEALEKHRSLNQNRRR